jgi:3-methyladenine DNA glycosylase Tag
MQHAPDQFKQPVSLSNYLEAMSKAGFQTGISWQVVDKKWKDIRENMQGFDPLKVSKFTGADIDRFMRDEKMIRNRKKLEGVVLNSRRLLELDKEVVREKTPPHEEWMAAHAQVR